MRNIILKYGLIAGGIVSVLMLLGIMLWMDTEFHNEYGELIGYTTMLIALSLIFFGVKSYRDNQGRGTVSFGKGVQIGLLITLIASVMYSGSWEIAVQTQPKLGTYMESYTAKYLEKMKEQGASEAEVQKQAEEMAVWGERYKNPVFRFGMTLMEIFPVGLIITLISAAILRKREVLPARASSPSIAA